MVGYIGPNGAGKSTSIKMLTGILVPTSGEIRINGFVPFRQRRQYVKTIGVVFGQRTQLWWDIAVSNPSSCCAASTTFRSAISTRAWSTSTRFLASRTTCTRRCASFRWANACAAILAAALLHNPPLLFLDEPTIGLDVVAKDHIRQFLRAINREFRTTVLLTTHDLDDIEELCRRIMIIDHGRVLYDGPLEDLKQQPSAHQADQVRAEGPCAGGAASACFRAMDWRVEQVDELTYRIRFDRARSSAQPT